MSWSRFLAPAFILLLLARPFAVATDFAAVSVGPNPDRLIRFDINADTTADRFLRDRHST